MKNIADQMTVGGFVVSDKELVMCILIGLGPEYETVFVNFTSRPHLPSLQEVKNYLVHYESKLEHNNIVVMFNSASFASVLLLKLT